MSNLNDQTIIGMTTDTVAGDLLANQGTPMTDIDKTERDEFEVWLNTEHEAGWRATDLKFSNPPRNRHEHARAERTV